MRWTEQTPVTWPSDQGFDAWWRGVTEPMDTGGEGAGPFDLKGGHVQLDAGDHLRPGAIYRWVPPEGAVVGSAAWGIGGPHDRRDLYAEYQEVADPARRVVVRLDGLDACGSMSVTSTLRHLAAEAFFSPRRDRLLDVEITLDWLLVRLRARVVPAESGEQLRVSLRVVGRGIWKPVIAPLLVPLGLPLRHVLTHEVEEAADRLTHLDEDPRGDGAPEREMERIRVGAELIRTRLHEVVRTVDARPFWTGRGRRALREAFVALPAVGSGWPSVSPAMTFGDSGRWWDEEKWIFDILVDANPWRRKRHEMVDQQVDLWLSQQETIIAHHEQAQVAQREAGRLNPDPSHPTAAEINEMMDLSWLATPWSTVRYLARQAAKDSPADDDLPPLETDEDARKFVTGLLKDL
ncbi:hypothetical protein [Ornithinimicrobium cavernae]|uniref:hypothetical protein n=1 Tax=Ornithinimicrobium cavernae TaxID=2666047 RepID=UPI0012B16F91|nr:hypothetical protein [Ornithinimicrobium cavernae]